MGVIVPENYYNATFVFSLTGSSKQLTWSLGFQWNITAGSPPPVSELAQTIRDAFVNSSPDDLPYKGSSMYSQYTYEGVSLSLMTDEGPLVGEYFLPQTGTVVGNPLPVNCSSLFTKTTPLGGRRNKGRAYIPPVDYAESNVSPTGAIDSAEVEAINERYALALVGCVEEGMLPVLFHSNGGTPTVVNALVMGPIIATQRRRLR